MEITDRPDGVVVVNDAYNANPDSMRAALDAVAAMHVTGERWAVLGGMLELGPDSDAEHAAVGSYAASLGFDHVVAVGEGARPLADAFPGSQWVPDTDAAHDLLAAATARRRRRPAQVEPGQRAALARRPARVRGRRSRTTPVAATTGEAVRR